MRWFATLTEEGMFGNKIMEVRIIRGYPDLVSLKPLLKNGEPHKDYVLDAEIMFIHASFLLQ